MYHWIVNMRLQAILECFVDDVIRSQNKSKLWTTIALSKFELEKRSTAQNVQNWTGYQKFKFQFHIQISKFWQVSNLRLPFHFACQYDSKDYQILRAWYLSNNAILTMSSNQFTRTKTLSLPKYLSSSLLKRWRVKAIVSCIIRLKHCHSEASREEEAIGRPTNID